MIHAVFVRYQWANGICAPMVSMWTDGIAGGWVGGVPPFNETIIFFSFITLLQQINLKDIVLSFKIFSSIAEEELDGFIRFVSSLKICTQCKSFRLDP